MAKMVNNIGIEWNYNWNKAYFLFKLFVKEMNYLKKAFKCVILLCSTKPESTGYNY